MASIHLIKAVSLHLGSLDQAVVTRYELGTLVYRLYRARTFRAQPLRLTKDSPQLDDLHRVVRQLLAHGVLTPHQDFPQKRVFRILGKQADSVGELACAVDPFAFVSHLSAMDYHGLTDRLPTSLYLSSPVDKKWKSLALQRMQKDCNGFFDDYLYGHFPTLRRFAASRIGKRPVERRGVSDFHGAYRTVKGRVLRIATIGRTFLDMLQHPALCGGIRHVIDAFDMHARDHLELVIDEVEKRGSGIDKVRAGYILEERCGISHPKIDGWERFVQRGGSRKLDAQAEYSSNYSERWSLSINVIGT